MEKSLRDDGGALSISVWNNTVVRVDTHLHVNHPDLRASRKVAKCKRQMLAHDGFQVKEEFCVYAQSSVKDGAFVRFPIKTIKCRFSESKERVTSKHSNSTSAVSKENTECGNRQHLL